METQIFAPNNTVRLLGLSGPYKGNSYQVKKDEFIIGRSPDSDLVMNETTVSAHHAKIVRKGSQFEIQDMGSSNGTFVNGVKIDKKPLRTDDKIKIDIFEFQFINPADVSRTIISKSPDFSKPAETIVRELKKTPIVEKKVPTVQASYPAKKGNLFSGLFFGVLISFLFGMGSMVIASFTRSGFSLGQIPQYLKNLAGFFPQLHLHHVWMAADWSSPETIIPAIGIPLGLILGGLLVKNLGGKKRLPSVLAFSLVYVILALVLQLLVFSFNVNNWPTLYQPLTGTLSGWLNLGASIAYFFGVVIIFSWIGSILGKKR